MLDQHVELVSGDLKQRRKNLKDKKDRQEKSARWTLGRCSLFKNEIAMGKMQKATAPRKQKM